MTEILLIRHGETAWNARRRLQGHLDIPLNEEGERQARALGRALGRVPLDAVYASDLQRALQTAQAIAAPRAMPVRIEPGLRERAFGSFEGMLYADLGARYPEAYADLQARRIDARPPGEERLAETLREFFERAIGAITAIVSRHHDRRVALVTHGGVLDCAYRAAQGTGMERVRDFDIFNASINRFRWDGKALHLLDWGDVSHLRGNAALDEVDAGEAKESFVR
jgi:2,3-bisphosphoglycerate-dependent phosphoglycerate mutase